MTVQKVAATIFFSAVIIVCALSLLSPAAREGTPKIGAAGAVGAPGWVLLTTGIVCSAILLIAVLLSKPKK